MTNLANKLNKKGPVFTIEHLLSRDVQNKSEALGLSIDMDLAVFPVSSVPGKKSPLVSGGYKSATRNLSKISEWWDGQYKGAMVGVPTGSINRIIAIDVDMKKGRDGLKSLATLEAKAGQKLPRDYMVRTPSGGYHFYFELKEGQHFKCSAGTVAEGIDIRADGGYVLSQDSINDAGEAYKLVSSRNLPELPDWFANLLRESESAIDEKLLSEGEFPEGQRNTGLFRLCAKMRSAGLEGERLVAFAIWANENLCKPPLPVDEVVNIVSNLDAYAASYTFDAIGYSERFADRFQHELKCVDGDSWFKWNGVVWEVSSVAANESAKLMAKELLALAKAMPEPQTKADESNSIRDSLIAHASKMTNAPLSVVKVAATDGKLARKLADFDSHPTLLNTPNCIVDLNTGGVLPHSAPYMLTKQTRARFIFEARSSLWEDFLAFYTDENSEIEAYLARVFGGIGLIDGNPDQVFMMLSGPAKNGKSTFSDNIMNVMGDYTDILRAEVLVGDASRDFRHDLADLQGARLVNTNEPPQDCKLNCAFVKGYTGGDMLKGRHNYAESMTFKGSGLLMFVTNWEPELPHGDVAMHRRILMYRHERAISDDKRDSNLKDNLKLPEHAEAILAWLVRGRLDYLAQGINPPLLIKNQIEDYIGTKDVLSAFLLDRCSLGDGFRTQFADLHRAFTTYRANEYADFSQSISQKKLAELLKRRFHSTKIDGKSIYHGLKLRGLN